MADAISVTYHSIVFLLNSNISYKAFASDAPCSEDNWREMCCSDICNKCNACVNNCPTGAIRKDRFLIDNERCLSYLNENAGDFPEWLSTDVHHTLYDCLRCQEKCPMNHKVVSDTIGPICFSEEEIEMLLNKKEHDDFSTEFMERANKIGLFDWSQGLGRNIQAIISLENENS